jgi:hypothetical protein
LRRRRLKHFGNGPETAPREPLTIGLHGQSPIEGVEMNLSRRFIVIAVLVVASAVSLGFAGMAQAGGNISGAKADCLADGGTFEHHVESDTPTSRVTVGTCTKRECTQKIIQVGLITIIFPSCQTITFETRWTWSKH